MGKLLNKYRAMPVQVRASLWFLICSFFQKGISTVTTPIFTRLLSTAEYGQYNVFNSWLGIATIFVSLNLSYGVYLQGLVKFEEEKNVFSSSLQGLTLLLISAWTAIYLIFHNFWNSMLSLTTVQMLAMLLMIWTSAVFGFWSADQRTEYKYRLLVIITLLVSVAKPVCGIVFILHAEDKVTARILGLALVELVGYAWLFVVQMCKGKVFYSRKYWKYAVGFNLPLIPHYLSQTVLNSADRIMIQRMVGASDAGVYSLAYSISLIMTLFNTALMQTITPWFYQKIKAKRIKDVAPIAYTTLIGIAALNLLLIVLAPEVVAIFAPASYYEAIYVIPPVAMSVYFMFAYDLFAKFAFYYEKTKVVMIVSVIGALLNIVLNYIFIGLFGYRAAGYTTLACYMVYAVGHYVYMKKVCQENCESVYPYEEKKLLIITVPFLLGGFLLLFTYNCPIFRYGIVAVVLLIVLIKHKLLIYVMNDLMSKRKG